MNMAAHDPQAESLAYPRREDRIDSNRPGERGVGGSELRPAVRICVANDAMPRTRLGQNLEKMEDDPNSKSAHRCSRNSLERPLHERGNRTHASTLTSRA